MAIGTGIEWTEATWNPLVGCSKVSGGCKHCYAEVMARRLASMPGTRELYGQVVHGADAGNGLAGRWNGVVALNRKALEEPLRRKKPTVYFVNSMSDLFHESVGDGWLDEIFGVMAACPQHVFQVLTKRPERMRGYVRGVLNHGGTEGTEKGAVRLQRQVILRGGEVGISERVVEWPLRNVWLGVSVEDQAAADARIPVLLDTPAAVRFLSCEPLLGVVDLGRWLGDEDSRRGAEAQRKPGLHWVIAGGESGRGAGVRPLHPEWVRGIRDACVGAGVPFFFKQWGEWAPTSAVRGFSGSELDESKYCLVGIDGVVNGSPLTAVVYRFGKKVAGRGLDGREWREMPVMGES